MTCNECRQEFILAAGEEAASERARHHLSQCAACQDFVRREEQLQAQVRSVAESERAPQALREGVEEMVREQPRRRAKQRRRRAGVAAAAILLMLAGYGLKWYFSERAFSPNRLAQQFIADHLHYLPGREEIISESPREVEKWFQGRVDFPVRVPETPAAVLTDARVCVVRGRKAALLHYRHKPEDTLVSLFIMEAPGAASRPPEGLASASYQGCNATLWARRGLVYSLVAALDDARLKELAESVRQQQP